MLRLTLVSILTLCLIQGSESYTVARMKRHTEELRDHLLGKISSASGSLETVLTLARATQYGGALGGWQDCKNLMYDLGQGERVILHAPVFASQVITNFTGGVSNLIDCLTLGVIDMVDCVFNMTSDLKQMGLDTKANAIEYGKNVTTVAARIKDEFLRCSGHPPTTPIPTTSTAVPTTSATTAAPSTSTPKPTAAPTTSKTKPTAAPTTTAPAPPSGVKTRHRF